LDEPTNHLDVNSIDAITSALRDWKGGVICVTHNPRFASRLKPTTVVRCKGGEDMREDETRAIEVELWPEGKSITAQDLYARDGEVKECSLDDDKNGNDEAAQAVAQAKELEAAERKAKEKRRNEAANAPKIIDKIERAMEVLDKDIEALSEKTLACGSDVGEAMKLQKQIDEKTEKRDAYFSEWERLEELMMEVEQETAGAAAA
jgi:ABC-type multidrug transport system ATPase subunit